MALQILLTNDDGIDAPGIAVLRRALDGLGDVTTIAPDRNTSAVARGITIHRALSLQPRDFGGGYHGLACDGTPSDCVRIALLGLRCPVPDLVVSGVNAGGNMGADVTYSGTVGAAFEAALRGHPAVAFSVEERRARLARRGGARHPRHGRARHRARPAAPHDPQHQPAGPAAGRHHRHPPGAAGRRELPRPRGPGRGRRRRPARALPALRAPRGRASGSTPTSTSSPSGAVAVTPLNYDLLDPDLLTDLAGWDLDLERLRGS